MKIEQAALEVLQETGNDSVMWGDSVLLHQIANRMGWSSNGTRTERRVLNALERSCTGYESTFHKFLTRTSVNGRERLVRIFRFPLKIKIETYALGDNEQGAKWIQCLRCDAPPSYNPNDISHLFCARCQHFHDAALIRH